jgi:LEA14-like dessication related protein
VGRLHAPVLLALAAVFISGCAAMIRQPEPPQVTLTGISLTSVSLFEQSFRVKLRLQNPNNYALPLDGFQLDLKLNDQPFLTGTSTDSVTLPRLGSATVEMDAVSKLAGLLQQIMAVASGETRRVHYSLTGKIHLVRPVLSLPIQEEGEFDMSWLEQRAK